MKKSYVFLLIGVGLLLFKSAAYACVMNVQVHDFPPYSYKKADEWQGSRVVLSTRLAEKLNCQVHFLEVPFGRAYRMLERGQLDFMFNLTKTPAREKHMVFVASH